MLAAGSGIGQGKVLFRVGVTKGQRGQASTLHPASLDRNRGLTQAWDRLTASSQEALAPELMQGLASPRIPRTKRPKEMTEMRIRNSLSHVCKELIHRKERATFFYWSRWPFSR